MKLQQLKHGTYFVVLPIGIVRAKNWQKGDNLKASIDEKGNIVIKK